MTTRSLTTLGVVVCLLTVATLTGVAGAAHALSLSPDSPEADESGERTPTTATDPVRTTGTTGSGGVVPFGSQVDPDPSPSADNSTERNATTPNATASGEDVEPRADDETPAGPGTATRTPVGADDTVVTAVTFQKDRISTTEQAALVVVVSNPQPTADTHTVTFELSGEVIETRDVSVPAGETTTVQFVYEIAEPGTYTARVDSESATIRVIETAGTTTPAASTPLSEPSAPPTLFAALNPVLAWFTEFGPIKFIVFYFVLAVVVLLWWY
jgi:hypothetical protein